MKRRSRARFALPLSAIVLFLASVHTRADAFADSQLSFGGLYILPAGGMVQLGTSWQASGFAQGGVNSQYNTGTSPSASAAGDYSLGLGSASVPLTLTYNVSGMASASNAILGQIDASDQATGHGTVWEDQLMITGGSGSVSTEFSININGLLNLSTDIYGQSAQAETVFTLQLNGNPVLFNDRPLSIGPNGSQSQPFSQTLMGSATLQYNTIYQLLIEADAEVSAYNVPEPGTGALATLGVLAALLFGQKKSSGRPLGKKTQHAAGVRGAGFSPLKRRQSGTVRAYIDLNRSSGSRRGSATHRTTVWMRSCSLLSLAVTILLLSAASSRATYIGSDPPQVCEKCGYPPNRQTVGTTLPGLTEGNLREDYPVVSFQSGGAATLQLLLTYNSYNADGSRAQIDSGLGLGWTHSYNLFLFQQRGSFFLMEPDGRITQFHEEAPGTYMTDCGFFETLTPLGGSAYVITNKNQSWWLFNSVPNTPFLVAGPVFRLIQMGDRNNNVTSLTYNNGLLVHITDTYGRSLLLGYTNKHLATITDPLGRTTQFQYDSKFRTPVRITDPAGKTVRYSYNSLYQMTRKIDRDNRTCFFLFRNQRPWAVLDGNGQTWFSMYNPTNWAVDRYALAYTLRRVYIPSTTTNTDGNGNTWLYQYDTNGYITELTAPDGSFSSYEYDPCTRELIAATNANGAITRYQYDEMGNRTNVTDALGNTTTYTYDPVFNQVTSITDPNGRITTYQYDSLGNKTNVIDPLGHTVQYTYNSHGNLTSSTDKDGHTTTYSYNTFGDRTNTTDPLGNITRYTYDSIGNQLSMTDPLGHTTTYQYDALDRVIGVTNALDGVTTYTYDALGRRTSITDPNTNTTTYAYDTRGRLVQQTDPLGNVIQYAYDLNNNLVLKTNQLGHVTTYTYDLLNRLIATTDAAGGVTRSSYDLAGNLISTTGPNTNTTYYTYDALNRVIAETNALGGLTRYDYSTPSGPPCCSPTLGSSLFTELVDPDGHITFYHYDALNRQTQEIRKNSDTNDVINPGDAVKTTMYDPDGNVTEVIDPVNNVTTYDYDAAGHRTNEIDGAGQRTYAVYDGDGNVISETIPNTNTIYRSYDALDREITETDMVGNVTFTFYDNDGNITETVDGGGNVTQTFYDADGRATNEIDPLGHTNSTFYDGDGNVILTIDEGGHQTITVYDSLDREIAETNAARQTTVTEYDGDGNVTVIIDGNGHATESTYDGLDRLVTESFLDAGRAITNTYDADGNLIGESDQNGRVITFYFDDLGEQTNETDASAGKTNSMTYDSSGRLVADQRGGWLVTYAYDGDGRVTNTTQNGYATTYTYDEAGRTRTIIYPSGVTITETLDARDRLIKVHDGTANPPIATYIYDSADRVVSRNYRNGTTTLYTYDADGRVTNIDHTIGLTQISGCVYAYDFVGNKLYEQKQDHPSASETYAYDAAERLTNFDVGLLSGGTISSPLLEESWLFDAADNWNAFVSNSVPELRSYDPDNELTNINGNTLYYDSDGSLVQDTAYAYSYDEDHHLTQVRRLSDSAIVGQYFYDAQGRRVEKITDSAGVTSTNIYLYDQDRIIEERDGAGNLVATYVYGNYIDEVLQMNRGGQSYYYHQNSLWSPLALTDSGGNVVERYTYQVYGSVSVLDATYHPLPANSWGTAHSAVGNPWLFTGRQFDEETGLYFYRARFYDPIKGRFLQRDPAGFNQSLNLYEYADSSPATFLDPFGLSVVIDCDEVKVDDSTYDDILTPFEHGIRSKDKLDTLIKSKKIYKFSKSESVKDYLKLYDLMADTDNSLKEANRSRRAWDATRIYLQKAEARIKALRAEGNLKAAEDLEKEYKKNPNYAAEKGQTAMYKSAKMAAQRLKENRDELMKMIKSLKGNSAIDKPLKDLIKEAEALLKESQAFSAATPTSSANPIAQEPSTTPEGFGATGGGEGFAAASQSVIGD